MTPPKNLFLAVVIANVPFSLYHLDFLHVMLILILIDVQYLQNYIQNFPSSYWRKFPHPLALFGKPYLQS